MMTLSERLIPDTTNGGDNAEPYTLPGTSGVESPVPAAHVSGPNNGNAHQEIESGTATPQRPAMQHHRT